MNLSNSQRLILAAALAAGLAAPVHAGEIYKTYDENGNPIFTDQAPEPGAEPITLRELSVVEAPEYASTASGDGESEDGASTSLNALRRQYRDFELVSPAPEQNFWGTGQIATIAWNTRAGLQPGMGVIFFLNGQPVTELTRSATFATPPLDRGEYQAKAELRDAGNRVVATAGPVTFFIKQNSRQFNRGGG